jgi:hypothetical protein
MAQRDAGDVWAKMESKFEAQRYEVSIEATEDGYWMRYRVIINRGGISQHWFGPSAKMLMRKGHRIADRLNRRLDDRDARQKLLNAIT